MPRFYSIAILSISLIYFVANANISSATIIRGAILRGMVINQDPCFGLSIGRAISGGAICAGSGYSGGGMNAALHYMVTPGGCTDGSCTGAGGTDTATMAWATGFYATNATGATDLNNGKSNTAIIVAVSSTTPAALWCSNMNYGGYHDWFLPARNELNDVLFVNKVALGKFTTGDYWSSTEDTFPVSFADLQLFNGGMEQNNAKTLTVLFVRCVRSY